MKALPKFKSDEEEADFWDRLDTTQIMEEGEQIELEYEPETAIENICIHCGKKMIERKSLDVHEKKRTKIWCVGKRIFLEIG